MAHEARSRAVTPRPQWGCGGWLTPRGGWLTHCGLTLLVGDRFRLVSITTRKQEQEQGQEWERQKKQHKISINTASICQHHFHGHQHLMLASVILLPLAPCQREPPSGGVSSLEAGIASTSECERCWMILDEFGIFFTSTFQSYQPLRLGLARIHSRTAAFDLDHLDLSLRAWEWSTVRGSWSQMDRMDEVWLMKY